MAAAAKKMGLKMMAGGIKKLVAAGYGVDEIEGMCGVGVEVLDEVLADAVRGGAAFNAVEKVALRGYMAAKARPNCAAPDAAPREDMEGRFIDIEEVESVESGLDGAEEDDGRAGHGDGAGAAAGLGRPAYGACAGWGARAVEER